MVFFLVKNQQCLARKKKKTATPMFPFIFFFLYPDGTDNCETLTHLQLRYPYYLSVLAQKL